MIRILDVSVFIHAGSGTKFGKTASYKGIPTGGIFYLLQQIAQARREKDILVLCFDSPSDCRTYLPEYKSNRCPDPKIRFQKKLANMFLREAIANCFKVEGYEADWLAYDICESYSAQKIHTICLHSSDYDWTHNIVSEQQLFIPATTEVCLVNNTNFRHVFSNSEVTNVLNSITAYKMFTGDASDSVKEFTYGGAYTNIQLFNILKQFCRVEGLDIREKSTMNHFVNSFSSEFGVEGTRELQNRMEVLYPRRTPEPLVLSGADINDKGLSKIISLTGCRTMATRLGIEYYEDMGTLQNTVYQMYQDEQVHSKTHLFTSKPEALPSEISERGGFIL